MVINITSSELEIIAFLIKRTLFLLSCYVNNRLLLVNEAEKIPCNDLKFPSNHCYDCVPTEPMIGIDFMVPLRIQTRNSSLGKWATVPLRNTNRAQSFTMLRHFKHFELFNYQQWLQMIAKYIHAWVEVQYWFVYSIAFQWMLAICIMKHGIHVNLYFQLIPPVT